ncbi:CASR protein, partial [Polyodon spathula]|nr:CASR protein [Polyodon spathula]
TCNPLGKFSVPGLYKHGDIVIGGVFPVYNKEEPRYAMFETEPAITRCVGFDLRAFRWTQAMIFAIQEINMDHILLPNVTLGYTIFNSCASPTKALRAAHTVLNGQEGTQYNFECPSVPVIIGESGSSQSIAISRTFGPLRMPMVINYFSTCACLSDKREHPTFFRTVPSDFYQARALAQLVKHFGWTWIATIQGDNEYGRMGVQAFTKEVKQYGVCVAFSENVLRTYPYSQILKIVETIKRSTVKVILAFASEGDLYPLMQEIVRQNITGIQWIASEAWITAARPSTKENFKSFGGAIGFVSRQMAIPELKEFLLNIRPSLDSGNSFVTGFWETIFQCTLHLTEDNSNQTFSETNSEICTGQERLDQVNNAFFDVTKLRVAYNVYKAVYAIAHALQNLIFCQKDEGYDKFKLCENISNIQPWQVYEHLQKIKFTNRFGEIVYFDENGDPAAAYDIINWHLTNGIVNHVPVGYFNASSDTAAKLIINEDNIIWNSGKMVPKSVCSESCPPGTRKAIRTGQPICCFDCIPCADGNISNKTDSVECMKCAVEYWSNAKKDKCIPKEIEFLSFSEAFGITLTTVALMGLCLTIATATVIIYNKNTPIVKANNTELSCLLLFSLVLCFLCSLTFIGEPVVWSCMLRHTFFGIAFALSISCVLGKTIVVVTAFKSTLPNSNMAKLFGPMQQRIIVFACTGVQIIICALWLNLSPPFPVKNLKHDKEKIILECNIGSAIGFSLVLGYIGMLSCICFVMAFLARKLPDNFNEAKYITFSMLIFCAVWLTFIPAYVSSPGKYTVAVEIFAILSSTFGLLICIFVPKCYIILLKPERNTRQYIMGKMPSKRL